MCFWHFLTLFLPCWLCLTEFVLLHFTIQNMFYTWWQRRVTSLCPSDAIWQNRSAATLAQVLTCYLMAPSHYPNQCRFFIAVFPWRSPESEFTVIAQATKLYIMSLKIKLWKLLPHLPGANELSRLVFLSQATLRQLQVFKVGFMNNIYFFKGCIQENMEQKSLLTTRQIYFMPQLTTCQNKH